MIALLLSDLAFATVGVTVPPTSVTVFADRARVTREATVNLATGDQEVVFSGLPATMFSDGMTADVRGDGVLRGIDVRRVTAAEIADRRVREIQAEQQALIDERQGVMDEAFAYQAEVANLEASRRAAASALSKQLLVGKGAPEQATQIRATLSNEETAARAAWRNADERSRDLLDRIAALDRERGSLGSGGTDTFEAIVHVEVARAGSFGVDLSYLVSGAGWVPRYDIRGDADKGAVEVALSAMVQQHTGEDWHQVELTVSSARPGLGTVVPTLDPFWLVRPMPVPVYATEGSSGGYAMKSKDMPSDAMEPEAEEALVVPMVVAQASVDIQLAATTFTVARPEDLPADGSARKVLLTVENLDAELALVTVPRVDPRAYLVAKVTNSAEFPLLPGTAGVFLSGAYLGDFSLGTVAPGAKFDVAFGVDDRVSVKRVPTDIQEGHTGIVGKRATARWAWEVRVKNAHRRKVSVAVLEQLPESGRQEVQVELLPGALAPKIEDGWKLRYKLTLDPGAEGKVRWGYTVTYPNDLVIGWME